MKTHHHLQDLLPIWPWIPAFRAVAETEHLPSAAKLLGIGPSSLSRTIAQVERAMKKPLFLRTGRSLRLNADGQLLLAAARDAMRRLDDGMQQVAGGSLRGVLTIASSGAATTTFVAPAIGRFRSLHPDLVPHVVTIPGHAVATELLRGKIDLAIQEQPVQREGLESSVIGTLSRGVYCGRNHAFFTRRNVRPQDVEAQEFVVPPASDNGVIEDGWPVSRPRRIAVVVDQLRVGVELCSQLPVLAVLPDILVASRALQLRRLPIDVIPTTSVFAIQRRPIVAKPGIAARFVAALTE